jgi:hypothetical protein
VLGVQENTKGCECGRVRSPRGKADLENVAVVPLGHGRLDGYASKFTIRRLETEYGTGSIVVELPFLVNGSQLCDDARAGVLEFEG